MCVKQLQKTINVKYNFTARKIHWLWKISEFKYHRDIFTNWLCFSASAASLGPILYLYIKYILNIYNIIFSTIDSVSQRVQQVREPDCRSYNVHLLWSVWQYFHFRNNILWFIEWYDVHLLWSVWQYFLFKTFFVPQTSSTMSTTTCSPVVRRRTMLITPGRKVLHLGSTSTT